MGSALEGRCVGQLCLSLPVVMSRHCRYVQGCAVWVGTYRRPLASEDEKGKGCPPRCSQGWVGPLLRDSAAQPARLWLPLTLTEAPAVSDGACPPWLPLTLLEVPAMCDGVCPPLDVSDEDSWFFLVLELLEKQSCLSW